jgi:hypothetical protein
MLVGFQRFLLSFQFLNALFKGFNASFHVTRAEVAACRLEDTAEIPVIETLGPTIL